MTDIIELLDEIDDYIARMEGNDRGACDAVNRLRAELDALKAQEPIGILGFDAVMWKEGVRPPENTRLFAAPQPAIPEGKHAPMDIAGALFDFLGYLTTREESLSIGASEDATPPLRHLQDWAARRGLSLSPADVQHWNAVLAINDGCAPSDAARDVLAERRRQIECEGFTPAHDSFHSSVELIQAACCYALQADAYPNRDEPPKEWPWAAEWWKPKDFRRDQIRATALLLAAIELHDRRSATPKPGDAK